MAPEVKIVETKKELAEFINLPWTVYKNYPHWIPPLKKEVEKLITPGKHPFWNHAERELYIALTNGRVAGRIAAIRDEHHDKAHGEKAGFFGFFETIEDYETAQALFNAARSWCKAKGCTFIRGPASPSSNDEYGFLLEGFDKDPFIMMPYNPRYYLDLMAACGLEKAKDLYAFLKGRERKLSPKAEEFLERLRKSGQFSFRTIDKGHVREEALNIAAIYNAGWEKNWGFVPWTDREMEHMAKNLAQFADLDLVFFAEHKGRTVGFAAALPDFNQVFCKMNGRLFPFGILKFLAGRRKIDGVRAIVFGVIPEFMHTGLAYLLYDEFEKAIIRKGHHWCELSWQLEDNQAINHFAASIGAVLYRKYRIYEKRITPQGA